MLVEELDELAHFRFLGWKIARVLCHFDEAIAMYRKASALAPAEPLVRWNVAIALLLQGNFTEGWPGYIYRHEAERAPTVIDLNQPMWDGSSLAGRGI